MKIHFDEDELMKVIHKIKFKGPQEFFYEVGKDENKVELVEQLQEMTVMEKN